MYGLRVVHNYTNGHSYEFCRIFFTQRTRDAEVEQFKNLHKTQYSSVIQIPSDVYTFEFTKTAETVA